MFEMAAGGAAVACAAVASAWCMREVMRRPFTKARIEIRWYHMASLVILVAYMVFASRWAYPGGMESVGQSLEDAQRDIMDILFIVLLFKINTKLAKRNGQRRGR
jgi:hypothetical protein